MLQFKGSVQQKAIHYSGSSLTRCPFKKLEFTVHLSHETSLITRYKKPCAQDRSLPVFNSLSNTVKQWLTVASLTRPWPEKKRLVCFAQNRDQICGFYYGSVWNLERKI